jgi:uncharacterized RDD family membrane protein YckC
VIDVLPVLLLSSAVAGVPPLAWIGVAATSAPVLIGVWVFSAFAATLLAAWPERVIGMTPGKLVVGLRVVPAMGAERPVRFFVRSLLKAATIACPLLLIAGVVHPRGWCLHDRLGRSIVVTAGKVRAPR